MAIVIDYTFQQVVACIVMPIIVVAVFLMLDLTFISDSAIAYILCAHGNPEKASRWVKRMGMLFYIIGGIVGFVCAIIWTVAFLR